MSNMDLRAITVTRKIIFLFKKQAPKQAPRVPKPLPRSLFEVAQVTKL